MDDKLIWMETTHGRKSKCKTEFKAVVNKVLVSTLILTTVLGTTMPAYAAGVPSNYNNHNLQVSYTQEYGVSVEAALQNIQNTVKTINSLKASGNVSASTLKTLANQLYSLETAVRVNGGKVTNEIKNVISQAENAIQGVQGAKDVEVALAVVKATLGIDTVTVENKQATPLTSFKDVAPTRWSHDAIMKMVKMGLFSGTTTPDANGVGTFDPASTMTRAQFITVVTRYLYADELEAKSAELKAAGAETQWYTSNYQVAVDKGLLTPYELGGYEGMQTPMTRQEMAMVLVRACDAKGEERGTTIANSRIPDYNSIGTAYRSYVKVAYTKGLIAGVDQQGTFLPSGTLTREQAAMVLYRLVDEGSRSPIDVNAPIVVVPSQTQSTWVEGQKHTLADMKEGAVVVKADGTKVVLKRDPAFGNVLGAGQGVDIFTGLVDKHGDTAKIDGSVWGYNNGILGKDLTVLKKCSITGEVHTEQEWNLISLATDPNGEYRGDYDGERFNTWWVWHAQGNFWYWSN